MAPLFRDLIHHVLPRAEVNIITSLRSLINYRSVMVIWLTSPVIYRRVKLPENTVSYGPLTGPVTNPYIGRPRLLSKRSRNSPKKNPFSAIGVRALPHHRIKPVLIRKPSFMDQSDWPGWWSSLVVLAEGDDPTRLVEHFNLYCHDDYHAVPFFFFSTLEQAVIETFEATATISWRTTAFGRVMSLSRRTNTGTQESIVSVKWSLFLGVRRW